MVALVVAKLFFWVDWTDTCSFGHVHWCYCSVREIEQMAAFVAMSIVILFCVETGEIDALVAMFH